MDNKLVIINFGNFVLVGIYGGKTNNNELVVKGALSYEGMGDLVEEVSEFNIYPLGPPHMLPDKNIETYINMAAVGGYTLLDLEDEEQDIVVKYRSFWEG